MAARLFAGETVTEQGIQVIADESGALADRSQTQSSSQTQLGGGATSSIFGGSRGSRLANAVERALFDSAHEATLLRVLKVR